MTSESSKPLVDDLNYLWDEYKYRHQLCWSAVYKVSAAVLALAIVPYAKNELTTVMGYWMLVPPAVGVVLAAFGIRLVDNELEIFGQIKLAYHTLQSDLLRRLFPTRMMLDEVIHSITPESKRATRFDKYVDAFMVGVLTLSIVNTLFLAWGWIPHVMGNAPRP